MTLLFSIDYQCSPCRPPGPKPQPPDPYTLTKNARLRGPETGAKDPMGRHSVGDERQQRNSAGPLDSGRERALVLGARAGLPALEDLPTVRNEVVEALVFLVINVIDLVYAEGAHLAPRSPEATTAAPVITAAARSAVPAVSAIPAVAPVSSILAALAAAVEGGEALLPPERPEQPERPERGSPLQPGPALPREPRVPADLETLWFPTSIFLPFLTLTDRPTVRGCPRSHARRLRRNRTGPRLQAPPPVRLLPAAARGPARGRI